MRSASPHSSSASLFREAAETEHYSIEECLQTRWKLRPLLRRLLKEQPCFRPGNCFASFGSVFLLPRVHVEPDVASQSGILIHASGEGKVGSYRRHTRHSISFEDWRPETSYWILENHPISPLINREAKL